MSMEKTQRIKNPFKTEVKTIPMVCSWCNKIYQIEEYKIPKDQKTGVSHGICPKCLAQQNKMMDTL